LVDEHLTRESYEGIVRALELKLIAMREQGSKELADTADE